MRLLGLRCTGLVSARRPDAAAFFGVREHVRPEVDEDGWEKLPEELLDEDAAPPSPKDSPDVEDEAGNPKPQADTDTTNTTPPREEEQEIWFCPICSHPQPAEERLLNEHIDLCLSRQTIRDAVQDLARRETEAGPSNRVPESGARKRGRAGGGADPRQKKLCFG